MSQAHTSKIRTCLEVYLARTRKAILALRQERFDNFNEFMHQRTMAFHNFRAIDANAKSLGYDVSSDPEITDVFLQLSSCEKELMELIAAAKVEANEQLLKLKKGRRQIARFKSRNVERKNLVQTV